MRQQRGRYRGPISIVGPDEGEIDGTAALVGFVELVPADDAVTVDDYVDGSKWWYGSVEATEVDRLSSLVGATVKLRTPDGREGEALVLDISGSVEGAGRAPFDL